MVFGSWWGLLRIAVASVAGYVALLVFLRVSGKRTLSKLNAFDFVVTIALGSTLSSLIVSRSTPVAEGVLALFMLVALQYAVAWGQVRSTKFQRIIKAEPTVLLYRGEFQREAMLRQRVTEAEIKAAIRDSGGSNVQGTLAVVLETDGSLVAISPSTKGENALPSGHDEREPRAA